MRKRYLIVSALVLFTCTGIKGQSFAAVVYDNFHDNNLNQKLWNIDTRQGTLVEETNDGMELTINASASGVDINAGVSSVHMLLGDFDIQVDYTLLSWPFSNGVRLGLGAYAVNGFATVERTSLGPSGSDFPGYPREVYTTNSGYYGGSANVRGLMETHDQTGKLRLERTGSKITGYYYDAGSGWVEVASYDDTNIGTTSAVCFGLHIWSSDVYFSPQGEDIKVALDNVEVSGYMIGDPSPVLETPTLSVATADTTVTITWDAVTGADGYVFYYAPYPAIEPIGAIDVGNMRGGPIAMWNGAAFFVAVQAYGSTGRSELSNIDYFEIPYTNSLGMTFKVIPAGTFTMGSPSDELVRASDETQHQVTLSNAYYMQTTEVTQAQWEAVMGDNPSWFPGCSDCPVENVSWNDVQEFIDKLNAMGEGTYRLPTEAEWEYACRADSTTAFANGEITEKYCGYDPNLDAMGWYCYNSGDETHPVAQKEPNAWGLYDMHGNVWEWCQDWHGSYPTGAVTDPTGPSSGTYRVLRGASWHDNAKSTRSANRHWSLPDERNGCHGFRVVRAL
jgi:formylglycine-generating enzyme required for sulfatase activity